MSLVLYATLVLVQTVRHRNYFLPGRDSLPSDVHAEPPGDRAAWAAFGTLLVALVVVVLLAKALAATVETAVLDAPESLAAYRAARGAPQPAEDQSEPRTGLALATIGLTIPSVAIVSIALDLPLQMGIDAKAMVLLFLSLFTITLTLGTGRTTVLGGAVHLVIFAAYLFTTIVP